MTVEHILAAKGRSVVTVLPTVTLGETARIMSERGIGAVIVTGPLRDVLGILSERDIVKAIAEHRGAALEHAVSSHMTTRVKVGHAGMSVTQAMEWMTQGRFRHLPIVEGGALDGLVSIGDIVKHRLAEIEDESRALRDYITTS